MALMKPIRPVFLLAGAVLVALLCIAFIPVPKPVVDFSLEERAATRAQASTTAPRVAPAASDAQFRDTRWSELVPREWNPLKQVQALQESANAMSDADPRAAGLLRKMRDGWDDAPTNRALDGAGVRIPGYVVPLEEDRLGVREFLLVPYFGACIHSPPPPSNQIIHVVAQRPVAGIRSMDTVWVSGTLRIQHSDSPMGTSGYDLTGVRVDPYAAADPSRRAGTTQ